MLTNGDELKCDGDGYFDLDAIKPYSSVWVSPKNNRTRCQIPEKESDITMKVASGKSSDLHSLLDSVNRSSSVKIHNDEPLKHSMSSTKSDQFHRENSKANEIEYKQLKKMSDKILESMCHQIYETGSEKESKCSNQNNKMTNEDSTAGTSLEDLKIDPETSNEMLNEEAKLSNTTLETSRSFPQRKCKGIHVYTTDSQASLTDNGKLLTELQLSEIDVKDQSGRDYHLVVKYVWETNFEQFASGALAVLDVSPSFVQLVNSLSPQKSEDKVDPPKSLKSDSSASSQRNINLIPNKKVLEPVIEAIKEDPITPPVKTETVTPETKPRVKKVETPVGKAAESKTTSFRKRVSSVASTQQERIEANERRARLSNAKKSAGTEDGTAQSSTRTTGLKRDERRPPTAPVDLSNKFNNLSSGYNNRFTRKGYKGKFGTSTNAQENFKK